MRALGLLALLTSLAACGADGEPVRPGINATIGVGSGGVHGAHRSHGEPGQLVLRSRPRGSILKRGQSGLIIADCCPISNKFTGYILPNP